MISMRGKAHIYSPFLINQFVFHLFIRAQYESIPKTGNNNLLLRGK